MTFSSLNAFNFYHFLINEKRNFHVNENKYLKYKMCLFEGQILLSGD